MQTTHTLLSVTLEDTYLTVEQIAAFCAVEPDWVEQHLAEGLLNAVTLESGDFGFTARELARAKRMIALERDFDALPELAALVADMQEELDALRRRLLLNDQS